MKKRTITRWCSARQSDTVFRTFLHIMKIYFFDTETTGIPQRWVTLWEQPYILQWGALVRNWEAFTQSLNELFCHTSRHIPDVCTKVHWITMDMVREKNLIYAFIEEQVIPTLDKVDLIVWHNISFDMNMLWIEAQRIDKKIAEKVKSYWSKTLCTMKTTANLLKIPWTYWYKNPKLTELYKFLFGEDFDDAHDAMADIYATQKCFFSLLENGNHEFIEALKKIRIQN